MSLQSNIATGYDFFNGLLAAGDEDAAAALTEDSLRRFCTYGTPRAIIAHMETLFEAGVDVFELGTPHGVREADAIRLLGEEVLPYFDAS